MIQSFKQLNTEVDEPCSFDIATPPVVEQMSCVTPPVEQMSCQLTPPVEQMSCQITPPVEQMSCQQQLCEDFAIDMPGTEKLLTGSIEKQPSFYGSIHCQLDGTEQEWLELLACPVHPEDQVKMPEWMDNMGTACEPVYSM